MCIARGMDTHKNVYGNSTKPLEKYIPNISKRLMYELNKHIRSICTDGRSLKTKFDKLFNNIMSYFIPNEFEFHDKNNENEDNESFENFKIENVLKFHVPPGYKSPFVISNLDDVIILTVFEELFEISFKHTMLFTDKKLLLVNHVLEFKDSTRILVNKNEIPVTLKIVSFLFIYKFIVGMFNNRRTEDVVNDLVSFKLVDLLRSECLLFAVFSGTTEENDNLSGICADLKQFLNIMNQVPIKAFVSTVIDLDKAIRICSGIETF